LGKNATKVDRQVTKGLGERASRIWPEHDSCQLGEIVEMEYLVEKITVIEGE
jgi:hypothetical protein